MIPYSALSVLLSSMEPDRPMWRTPDGQIIRAEQLEALPQKYKNAVAGRSVALRARHSVGCASFMLALDGVADSIVFLPMSLSPKALALIVEQTKPDFLLSDDAAADASLGLPVLTAQPQSPSLPEIDATSTAQAKTRWIIPTSGTTATPKLVVHTLASLTRTVNVNRLAGKQYRWGSLYNLMGFAGLQVFFRVGLAAPAC